MKSIRPEEIQVGDRFIDPETDETLEVKSPELTHNPQPELTVYAGVRLPGVHDPRPHLGQRQLNRNDAMEFLVMLWAIHSEDTDIMPLDHVFYHVVEAESAADAEILAIKEQFPFQRAETTENLSGLSQTDKVSSSQSASATWRSMYFDSAEFIRAEPRTGIVNVSFYTIAHPYER